MKNINSSDTQPCSHHEWINAHGNNLQILSVFSSHFIFSSLYGETFASTDTTCCTLGTAVD